jgi:tetratricopeptide (TPR) repeat protein
MLRRFACSLLALSLACGATRSAFADEPSKSALETARQRYQEGAQAFSKGHFADAVDLFLDANRAAPNPAFAYNIGLAYDQLGDTRNALRWFRAYLREVPNAPDRPQIEPRIEEAEKRLTARGVQQVTVLSDPGGATVVIDDQRLGVTPWTGELAPGSHTVTLELPGYETQKQTFELTAEHALDVSLTLLEAEKAEAPAAAAPVADKPVAAHEPSFLSAVKPLTWASLGVTVVGLGTAIGFNAARGAEVDDAEHSTQIAAQRHLDSANSDKTAARVFVGVGAAFAVASGALLYFDLSGRHGHEGTSVAGGCVGGACRLIVNGRF